MIPTTVLMGGGVWTTVGMIAVVIIVFYFFGIRPQKKQEREAAEMRDNLAVGDEITTIGGIIGKIISIKEETMVIETTRDHTRIRLLKSAVRTVDVRAEDAQPARKPVEDTKNNAKNGKKTDKNTQKPEATEAPEDEQSEGEDEKSDAKED